MKRLLRILVRLTYRTLVPRGVKNHIRLALLLDERDKPPVMISQFHANTVLVLAPHMDDETIGCGGAVMHHRQAGAAVTVIYLTDGSKGDPDLYTTNLAESAIHQAEKALIRTRKQEAHNAARVMDINELVFLDGPDGNLAPTEQYIQTLARWLSQHKPQLIYHPSVMDSHDDHWTTNRILAAALHIAGLSRTNNCLLRGYEVWSPLHANRLIDIGNLIDRKREALACFESQTRRIDYIRAMEGLSAYRSIYFGRGRGYFEAFYECTPAAFESLMTRVHAMP